MPLTPCLACYDELYCSEIVSTNPFSSHFLPYLLSVPLNHLSRFFSESGGAPMGIDKAWYAELQLE